MVDLKQTLSRFLTIPGVRLAVLVGRDGLLIEGVTREQVDRVVAGAVQPFRHLGHLPVEVAPTPSQDPRIGGVLHERVVEREYALAIRLHAVEERVRNQEIERSRIALGGDRGNVMDSRNAIVHDAPAIASASASTVTAPR